MNEVRKTANDPFGQRKVESPEDLIREGWLSIDCQLLAALGQSHTAQVALVAAQLRISEILEHRERYAAEAATKGIVFFPDLAPR